MRFDDISFSFAPLLPYSVLAGLALIAALLILMSAVYRRRALLPRILLSTLFFAYLSGISLQEEAREHLSDTALIVQDNSASQKLAGREKASEEIQTYLQAEISKIPLLEPTFIQSGNLNQPETNLSEDINTALANIPDDRRAGILLITDGQVHDALKNIDARTSGPVHVFLTGAKNEKDRYIELLESPPYGIVGQSVKVRFKIKENPDRADAVIPVTLLANGKERGTEQLRLNEEYSFSLDITHPGANFFELIVPAAPDEITDINNRIAFSVNGVRDRLKVLLVSGKPHMGGRMWRNLLKSDPSVDLVHFTILRQPDKQDNVPQHELSLIPFPFQELFEEKLYDFDLIIFDRYNLNHILPLFYFENIANYVRDGGALLEASGPEYAGDGSIYNTALSKILPAAPTGKIFEQDFIPALSKTGLHHPVTSILNDSNQTFGPWLRQIEIKTLNSQDRILLTGAHNAPLLLIGERAKGRIAQMTSDQIWLWERGYDGGGNHMQLLRRLVHWLMKEPELEEEKIEILSSEDGSAQVTLRTLNHQGETVRVAIRRPDGETENMVLSLNKQSGLYQATLLTPRPGLYTVLYKEMSATYAAGDLQSKEFQNVLTSTDKLAEIVKQTGGSFIWAKEDGLPALRHLTANKKMDGYGWIGLRQNDSYHVTSLQSRPLLPPGLWLALFVAALLFGWLRESRS